MIPTTDAFNEMDASTDTASDHSSLDTLDLGLRLSQLSRAKVAVAINNVHRVQMCRVYDREAHVTAYVLDVYLQAAPRGLPKAAARHQQKEDHSKRQDKDKDQCADYQVEHRYSTFRALRERIGEAVAVPKDKSHPRWCAYCTRVRELVNSGVFPSRFPSSGRVAIATGLHGFLVRTREQRLEAFMNLLLRAAKDISYRSGCTPCGRFEVVSRLLSDFLMEPHLRASDSAW